MIELFRFQQEASATAFARFQRYVDDPVVTGTTRHPHQVPFFQALSSITASGKTAILADIVATVSQSMPIRPVVLWISKGKVVVEQSYADLAPGGKYHHLLGDAEVRPLADYDATTVAIGVQTMVFFATVGTFNQKDKEKGTLSIYKGDLDNADHSIWDSLKLRLTDANVRRPLLVIYDEGHNLSDQQTDLLLELEPVALFLASATMRLPARLSREVADLENNGWSRETLVTTVDAKQVSETGLVRNDVKLVGYQTPMEEAVSQLLSDLANIETDASAFGLPGKPKAIYVCETNTVAGSGSEQDNPKQPFNGRKARPILIWRYLTERHGIDPDEIAVYCSLKMDKNFPAPDEFHLFSGGAKDYEEFVAGAYRHIIFNKTLQEGWDDPLAYCAYIDKSMGSEVAVEQVIGRVLRQPGAKHYPAESLNAARMYVRVDRSNVFNEMIERVDQKIGSEMPTIKITVTPPGKTPPVEYPPKQPMTVSETAIISTAAEAPIVKAITTKLNDYRQADVNTKGAGRRAIVQRLVGETSSGEPVWETFEQSGRAYARWFFQREIVRRYARAAEVAPTDDPKFDAEIGFGSIAETNVRDVAAEVVDLYLDNVVIRQKAVNPYVVGPLDARPDEVEEFTNALHGGYAGLNVSLELPFAKALDKTGLTWTRNPSPTGYRIPLPTLGSTSRFFPDFIVWSEDEDDVYLVDTKGEHLALEAVARKLLNIERPAKATQRLHIKLVAKGDWNKDGEQETKEGWTVFGFAAGGGRSASQYDDLDALLFEMLVF